MLVIIKRSIIWALTGSVIGVVLWAVVGGTVGVLSAPGESVAVMATFWPGAVIWTGFQALVVAAVALPVYVVILAMWQKLLQFRPQLYSSPARQFWSALALSAPVVAVVTLSFGGWSEPFPFRWGEALRVLPIALVSCFWAMYLPRRLLPALRTLSNAECIPRG